MHNTPVDQLKVSFKRRARENIFYVQYTFHKNSYQKIMPAHSVITMSDFILRGSYFCEKYFLNTCFCEKYLYGMERITFKTVSAKKRLPVSNKIG